jgi:hypothetical protein
MSVRHDRQMRGTIRILQNRLKDGHASNGEPFTPAQEMEINHLLAKLSLALVRSEKLKTKVAPPIRAKKQGPLVPETFS